MLSIAMYMPAAPLREAGGAPLDCCNTCEQHGTGILTLPSTGHAVNLQGIVLINSNIEHH